MSLSPLAHFWTQADVCTALCRWWSVIRHTTPAVCLSGAVIHDWPPGVDVFVLMPDEHVLKTIIY